VPLLLVHEDKLGNPLTPRQHSLPSCFKTIFGVLYAMYSALKQGLDPRAALTIRPKYTLLVEVIYVVEVVEVVKLALESVGFAGSRRRVVVAVEAEVTGAHVVHFLEQY